MQFAISHKKLTCKRSSNRLIMASQPEIFDISGPLHLLTSFDWRNTFHRRSLAASLVQGVYSLERDRQRASTEHIHEDHASPWWQRFQFQLNHVLVDDSDLSYFGAIYELQYAHPLCYHSSPSPPRYVIAFRGTIITNFTRSEDMKLNIKCVFAKLEQSSRYRTAFEAVSNTVAMAGPANVWLTGHSLGASIATLVGKNMAKKRFHLETYLFNPPFISVPIENVITNEPVKHCVRIAGSIMKAGIAAVVNGYKREHEHEHEHEHDDDDDDDDLFVVLSEWKPYVYVNPSDPISAEYIGYFEHREVMEEIGVGGIGRISTRYSIGSLVSGAIGREMEPLRILPTAYVTVNVSSSESFRQAHGVAQWWQPHYQWQSKLYKFKTL